MRTELAASHPELPLTSSHELHKSSSPRAHFSSLDLFLLALLAVCALLPRLFLAQRLDMVTDESVYILAGKLDLHLATHLAFSDPSWSYNYEHPSLVKLLIGLSVKLTASLFHLFPELFAARLPSVASGTLLVLALYFLGKSPFGRPTAFAAALCLAFSPWLCFFSALAYLDTSMTFLLSLAFLLLWYAPRYPWLYLLISCSLALATASKYTALLALPAILFYILCSSLSQPTIKLSKLSTLPWLPWLFSCLLFPIVFLSADPSIWHHPLSLLKQSLLYQLDHSLHGHLTFLAGSAQLHAPFWTVLFISLAKLSLLVTLPAFTFILLTATRLLSRTLSLQSPTFFLFCWLIGLLLPLSQLSIVVGTHYELPVAPPLALAASSLLFSLFSFLLSSPFSLLFENYKKFSGFLVFFLLCITLASPHFSGLLTTYAAEGYTSEAFSGENTVLQVAYPAYREGAVWIAAHSHSAVRVGLVALENTLNHGSEGVSWYDYNAFLPSRLTFHEALPTASSFPNDDFLIWPMHLVQRGYALPPPSSMHIVHTITGGHTLYCYILARSTVSIFR